MSPTSISGGGNLLTGGELISPTSLKGQEEVFPSAKLEQWPYKKLPSARGQFSFYLSRKNSRGNTTTRYKNVVRIKEHTARSVLS
jgi:hypothetical protein